MPYSFWTYQRSSDPLGIEVSDWVGIQSPSLSAHLHDEPQLSIVFSGLRRFQIGAKTYNVRAGEMILIPSGVPHASVGIHKVETNSRDIFLKPKQIPVDLGKNLFIGSARNSRLNRDVTVEEVISDIINDRWHRTTAFRPINISVEIINAVKSTSAQISEIAQRTALSREGFIRKFTRETGMTPLNFRLAHKATRARSMLRLALAPAAVAYDAGFADQSHLGRVFKKNFGTTPARFQQAWLS